MCDVGQGDATVLRSGPDRAVLVDAGPDPALADGCLRRLGVRHLDLVVLTHFHADHVGGLPGALAGRDAEAILVSPLGQPADGAAAVLREAGAARIVVSVAAVGRSGRAGTGAWAVEWRVIAASATTGAGENGDDGTVVNEASVALDVTVRGPSGPLHAVLLGDLETQGQEELAGRLARGSEHLEGPVDVVKVAHHGSAKQSEDLYRRIQARVGLIGVGAGNDYGHPAPSALALLRRSGTVPLRTDLSGDLAVVPGPGGALVATTSR
jgi:competence protein ComEC